MQPLYNVLVKLTVVTIFFILFYYYVPLKQFRMLDIKRKVIQESELVIDSISNQSSEPPIYIWCIMLKIDDYDSLLLRKLEGFSNSILQHTKHHISLNILTDAKSRSFVQQILNRKTIRNKFYEVPFHDVANASAKISFITNVMQEHFSSRPGTYYSDSLFYLSLGLYKIAPEYHSKVILLDVDMIFQNDIEKLYRYFDDFGNETLFALAPELSPVYHHILWKYLQVNENTTFGTPLPDGFPGVNSGVVLMHLDRIRQSKQYAYYISKPYVTEITKKYIFQGHLGDQDFYTLLAAENPHIVYQLPCNWNRQLCQWWKNHGYANIFDKFSRCDGPVYVYHGNCNTPIPVN